MRPSGPSASDPGGTRGGSRAGDVAFALVFGALTLLAAAPFWLTRLLPMQDYPQILVFARAYGDCHDPASPFFGTYTTGFPLSPLVLPLLLLRGIGALVGLETAGRVMWTLYAVGLPAASLHLLRVLGRDRWAVLLVFPLVFSYWAVGGFFAFATSAPLLVLGLSLALRWLAAPSWRSGAAFCAVLCALHLWHSLTFAQLLLDFGILWLLHHADDTRARLRALAPLAPPLLLFAAWMVATVYGRTPGERPPTWPPFLDNAKRFFELIGPPSLTRFADAAAVLAVVLLALTLFRKRPGDEDPPEGDNPFAVLAVVAAVSYLILPVACFGVEGINNRQPWTAALLFVFGWRLPDRPAARAALLAAVGTLGVIALVHMARLFAAFSEESAGASRLIDRLGPGDTLLAPLGAGATASISGKPLVALDLYATIRHGGLPKSSFAGYDVNFIRYAGGKNPMPNLGPNWLAHPALPRFDYVLLRGATVAAAAQPGLLRPVAEDGGWSLFAVCGSKALPQCR